MEKTKKGKRSKSAKKTNATSSDLLNATLPPELNQIMSKVDDHVKQSEVSMKASLQKTYQLIDEAKSSVGQFNKDTVEPKDEKVPMNDKAVSDNVNPVIANMQSQMEKAQEVLHLNIQQANLHVQNSVMNTADTLNNSIQQGQHVAQHTSQQESESQTNQES